MRLRKNSKLFIVYIKVDNMRWPIIVPIPFVVVEELLQGLAIVAWLAQGSLQGWIKRRPGTSLAFISRIPLWRLIAAGRGMVQGARKHGSFDIINVETEDAKVRIGLL